MNRQSIRQDIVADLDLLLQAAKAQTQYDEQRSGIGKKTDSLGRTIYMNLNKGKRATTKEWQAVFGADTTKRDKERGEAQDAKSAIGQRAKTREADLAEAQKVADNLSMVEVDEKGGARKETLQKAIDKQKKPSLGEMLQDNTKYGKEALEAFGADVAVDLQNTFMAGSLAMTNLGTTLKTKEGRDEFGQNVSKALDGMKTKSIEQIRGFAGTVMDGIGTQITKAGNAIKDHTQIDETWKGMVESQTFKDMSAGLNASLQAIQGKTNPKDVTGVNKQIANAAYMVNLANARMEFLATQMTNKEGKAGMGVIEQYKSKIENLENASPADIKKIMEEFQKDYENAEAKMWATITKQAQDAQLAQDSKKAQGRASNAIKREEAAYKDGKEKGRQEEAELGRAKSTGKQAPSSYTV